MTKRRFLFRLILAATPSLVILAALVAWLWLRPNFVGRTVDEVVDHTAVTSTEGSAGEFSPTVPAASGDLAVEPFNSGDGEHSISGTAVDPSRQAVARAVVFLLALDGGFDGGLSLNPETQADSDDSVDLSQLRRELENRLARCPHLSTSADGRFEFAGIDPGTFRLVTRREGFLPDVSDVIVIDDERSFKSIELVLRRTEALRGVVLTVGNSPVSGARIDAERQNGGPDLPFGGGSRDEAFLEIALAERSGTGRSDASGRFDITGLLAGYYDLQVRADGFARRAVADAPTSQEPLEILLQPELYVHGEVVGRDRQPIADAEVRLTYLCEETSDPRTVVANRTPAAVERAHTDTDGRFSIGGLAPGIYRAEVDRTGYLRAIVPVVTLHQASREEEKDLVFELQEGHSIEGIVRSNDGESLSDARVRARFRRPIDDGERHDGTAVDGPPSESQRVRSTLTTSDGSFSLTSLPAGLYELAVSAEFHRDQTIEGVATDGKPIEVALERGIPVEGRIVDRHTGEPIARAVVTYYSPPFGDRTSDAERARKVRTDLEGRFRIDSFPEGQHPLHLEAEEYQTLETEPIEAESDAQLTFTMERSGSVSGRVRASPGMSVDGLRVSLLLYDEERNRTPESASRAAYRVGPSSTTDADGFYRLPLPDAASVRVLVEGHPYVTTSSSVIAIPHPQAQMEGIDILVRPSATVRGFVVGQDLRRIAGAEIRVIPVGAEQEVDFLANGREDALETPKDSIEGRSDAVGEFEIQGLQEGMFRLLARAVGFINAHSGVFELAFGSTHVVEIEMEPEMTIAGHVRSPEGDPIPAAEIRARVQGESAGEFWSEERTVSSARGTFRLGKLANRLYDIRITAKEFASTLLEDIPAGASDIDARLERLVSVSGKVIGSFTEEPVVDYRLRFQFEAQDLLSSHERETLQRWREFRDPDGAFSVDELPPGQYLVEVEAPGYSEGAVWELELPFEGLEDAVIPIPEIGLVAGVVFNGHGNPVAGARVQALVRTTDRRSGGFIYRPYSASFSRSRRGREPADGDARRDGSGRRRPNRGERNRPRSPVTRDDGSFFLRELPDGVYRVRVTHEDYVPREVGDYALENGFGGDAALGLRIFLASGATLRGSVRGLAEVEGGQLTVSLRPNQAETGDRVSRRWERKSARVDSTGRFEIRGLTVGEYTLSARFRRAGDGSRASVRRLVEIHEADRERGVILDLSQ